MKTWFEGQTKFQKTDFLESSEPISNPGCGWYHIYSFVLGKLSNASLEETRGSLDTVGREEGLALVRIDIGAFRECGIPQNALLYIEQILRLFHVYKKQIILRFVYDTIGKGMKQEPADIAFIVKHMGQLGDIICKHADDILVLQGIFVGNWGEMHGSKFLDELSMTKLLYSLNAAVKGKCFLAVRTPAKWRTVMRFPKAEKELRGKVALFNDGLFGSPTDLGTYGEGSGSLPDRCGRMGRDMELEWQSIHMENLPNGGEAVAGDKPVGYLEAAKEMEKLHLSYLSSVWQKEQLEYWQEEKVEIPGCFNGLSGYEYIGRHLGYRFVIRDAKMISGKRLQITVENCGFAGLCEEAECFLIAEDENGSSVYRLPDIDARRWKSGQRTQFTVSLSEMPGDIKGGRIYLKLQRKRDGRNIYFANQGPGSRVLLGEFELRGFLGFKKRR